MTSDLVTICLRPEHFGEMEKVLASHDGLTASTFRYSTGVCGLRIRNEAGQMSMLPFQGQQIWDAEFLGRTLTMRSMFAEPTPTLEYLRTYGAFLLHCGATAMGDPGPADRHPLHGELPNAFYQTAQLLVGRNEGGSFMALTGSYQHTVAFGHNYVARPTARLAAGSSRIEVDLEIRNLKRAPMELMYLAHINFRPVDQGILVDAVPDNLRHIRPRASLPSQFVPSREYLDLLEYVQSDPAIHRTMDPDRRIDPELVLALVCRPDETGWVHSMQIHPDGSADFVSHRPDELDHGIRWISRTVDQDALGLLLPATAESDGYTAERAKGNIRTIPPEGAFSCRFAFGALEGAEAEVMRRGIEALRAARGG
jgi:hypothetical protein